ncbi:hypothetical protein N6H14_04290 [Paenibacillus sp. CC-CFT747]|nr:hypothetical protein N6H14_04290 [Paenibacillus sp. CC-CFT747]
MNRSVGGMTRLWVYLLLASFFTTLSFSPWAGLTADAASSDPQYEAVPLPLPNPGFEQTSGDKAVGWTYWKSGHAYGMTVSSSVYTEGSRSLKLDLPLDKVVGIESQKVDVVPGQRYRVTASVYSEWYDPAVTTSTTRIWLRFYNDTTLLKDFGTNVLSAQLPQGQWTDLSVEAIAPANANKVMVFFYGDKGSAFLTYFDNVRLNHLVPVTPGKRTLQNPGFESPRPMDRSPAGRRILTRSPPATRFP